VTADGASLTERVLRRDRRIVVAGLIGLTLLAWAYVLVGAGMGMPAWEMATLSLFPHREAAIREAMAMAMWSPRYFAIVVAMWWVMMIAMMTPSAAPVILLYARAARHAQAHGRLPPRRVPVAEFAAGYLAVWLLFSVVAAASQLSLEASGAISHMRMASGSALLSGVILIAAGLYQLSPLKHVCLARCRTPAAFISQRWRPGAAGAFRMGSEHGAFCVGCCWVLMALLFVGGVMNVIWVAALAVLVLIEKLAPYGERLAQIAGATLLGWGAVTLLL
jgi:predicted metal-binding membrane protein